MSFRIVPTQPSLEQSSGTNTEYVLIQKTLHRILAFSGHSIDDVVNDPIVKNKVKGWFRVHRQVERRSEIVELEEWWNG